jgi:two-component system, sensor histidine kinase PdtaS
MNLEDYFTGKGNDITNNDLLYRLLIDFWDEGLIVVKFLTSDDNKVFDVLILDANEAIQKQTGLRRKDLIGKHATEVLPTISDIWFSRFNEIVSSSSPIRFEEFSKTMNKWLEIKSIPLGPDNIFGILVTNITLRKYNQQLLSDETQQFTSGKLNGIAHCRIIVDENGTPYDYDILKINDNYTRIIGLKKEEIEGKRVREVFPGIENFSFNYIAEYGKVALEGLELNAEAYFETTKQHLRLYAFSLKPGEFTVVFTDITAEKQMEISHKHQTELLQSLLNSIPVMITIYDADVTNFSVNREFEHVTGWTQEEISRGNIMQMVCPDPEYRDEVIKFMQSGKGWRDIELTIKNGSKLISSWANIKTPDGRQVGIGIDISERKKAERALLAGEERFRSTLDNLLEGCAILGYNWDYLYVNESNAKHAHLELEEMIGKNMLDVLPGVENSVFFKIYEKCMIERTHQSIEAEYTFIDGTSAWYEVKVQPVPEGIFLLSNDITARKMTEKALRESEERHRTLANNLQQANEVIKKSLSEKDFLMKEIHHRVKNNLQIISSLLQLQMDRLEDQNLKIPFIEGVNRIRAIAMIHEKLYTKNLEMVKSIDYIPELVNLIVNSYKVENQHIDIDLQISRLPLEIDNAVYLGLLLNEILSNAYKHAFINRDSGKITVKLIPHSDNKYELLISDNGIGLPAEVYKKGLGMLLIETLVEQIEGKLEVNSIGGTEYKITFGNKL